MSPPVDTAEPAVLYAAPIECVDEATFRGRLAALPRSRTPHDPPRRISVAISPTTHRTYEGTLSVVDSQGSKFERNVDGATCDDVVDALELVTALALGLEPTAKPRPTPTPASAPAPAPAPASAPAPAPSWHLTAGADAAFVDLLGPGVRIGFAPFLSLELGQGTFWSPQFRIAALWLPSGTLPTSAGTATLTLTTAAAEGCPFRLSLAPDLAARPCAGVQVGVLDGSGAGASLVNPRASAFPWYAASGVARIDWTILHYLVAEAQVGVLVPFRHDRFYFGPDTTIYDVPSAAAFASAGLGARFP